MTGWKARRFWAEASPAPVEGGFGVFLDGRPLRTPEKAPLVVPTGALARAVAAEWQAQEGEIDPRTMPLTRAANSAIDRVAPRFAEVAAGVAAYADSDLLCYRAEAPQALIRRQAAAWDPLLAWASAAFACSFRVVPGLVHAPQPPRTLAALDAAVRGLTPFELTALHDLVSLSGSLVLGLAALRGGYDPGDLWTLSRIDEDWQAAQWGQDAEAAAAAEARRQDFLQAHLFWTLCRQEGPDATAA